MNSVSKSEGSHDSLLLTGPELTALIAAIEPTTDSANGFDGEQQRLLSARGLIDERSGSVVSGISALIGTSIAPSLTVVINRQDPESLSTHRLSVTPDLGTEQHFVTPSIQAFAPFEPADLIDRIGDLSEIDPDRKQAPGKPFPLSVAELRRCEAELATSDEKAARATLQKAGADKKAAAGFVAALEAKQAAASVTVLHRTESDRMEGGTVTWIDGGEAGLWVCDTPNPLENPFDDTWNLTIRPVGGAGLLGEISGYLPPGHHLEAPAPG